MVALAGEYHSVVARAAAAKADALGVPFLCSSAILGALTDQPTQWVARLAPAQSQGWQVYADFLLAAGHRRIALTTEPSVYWASGAGMLRDYYSARDGAVVELDVRVVDPVAVYEELVASRATAVRRTVKASGPGQRRDPVLALPARAPEPTRRTSQDGPAWVAG